jgi:hypothetical protein
LPKKEELIMRRCRTKKGRFTRCGSGGGKRKRRGVRGLGGKRRKTKCLKRGRRNKCLKRAKR